VKGVRDSSSDYEKKNYRTFKNQQRDAGICIFYDVEKVLRDNEVV